MRGCLKATERFSLHWRRPCAELSAGGESLNRLLAQVHKPKKVEVVVKKGGGGSGHTTNTPTITPIGTGDSSSTRSN
jgi:hypothetical protein